VITTNPGRRWSYSAQRYRTFSPP